MTESTTSGKADFSGIYNEMDAREYYPVLQAVQYEIPQHGADLFSRLVDVRHQNDGQPPTILDVCCSYGIGGMLAKTDLALDEVYQHYQEAAGKGLAGDHLIREDIELLSRRRRPDAPRVIGLDVAENATRYAVAIGALDEAFAENLETSEPSADLARQMRDVDMITTTGGVGYVTGQTFGRLLDSCEQTPWVAAFCLRAYDYEPIARTLAERGLVTEKASQSFPQRRFVDEAEQQWATAEVASRGLDPAAMESDGRYYADFYLSRPERDVDQHPLRELVPPASGSVS
jgi:hypothetical protein